MNQLMETLFTLLDGPRMEAEAKAVRASKEAIRAAQQRLTYEEFEDLWDAISGIGCAGELDAFTLGFRLGVQLMLEGLRPLDGQPS